jgi:retron-type reverse transcriptase
MKRHGNLFEQIVDFENLRKAARRAFRGKKQNIRVAEFYFHLETELLQLQEELCAAAYQPRPYRAFEIHEPKKRMICAADFRDRVLHHAICNILDPIFENGMIHDTYACRRRKGTHAALKRAQQFARQNRYFLKLDIEQHFPNIDHRVLKGLLRRKLKDPKLLQLLDIIIDHPIPGGKKEKGLPIGNLTSQYFANFYLGQLDHFLKHRHGVRHYLRYMDDFIQCDDQKKRLHLLKIDIQDFVQEHLKLKLKEKATLLAPVSQGIPFLGFRVYPNLIRLQGQNWRRFRKKVRQKERAYRNGDIELLELIRSVNSMIGHMVHADTHNARQKFFQTDLWRQTY